MKNQFSKKFENNTVDSLYAILTKSIGINAIAKFNDVLKHQYEKISRSFNDNGYVVDQNGTKCDIAILQTGNSNNKSDAYVLFIDQRGKLQEIGIEMKEELSSILFTTSFKIDYNTVNDKVFDTTRHGHGEGAKYLSGSQIRNIEYLMISKNNTFITGKDLAEVCSWLVKALKWRWYNSTDLLHFNSAYSQTDFITLASTSKFSDQNADQTNYSTQKFNDIMIHNKKKLEDQILNVLAKKCIFEIEAVANKVKSMPQVENTSKEYMFIYSVYQAMLGKNLYKYDQKYCCPLSNKCMILQSSTLIKKLTSELGTTKLFDFTVNDPELIKWYFNYSRTSETEYKPVYYIALGEKYDYATYKLTSKDPLGFDMSSKQKPGNIDTKYFGVVCKSAFRSYSKGNTISFVTRVYPLLEDQRNSIGSIFKRTMTCNIDYMHHNEKPDHSTDHTRD